MKIKYLFIFAIAAVVVIAAFANVTAQTECGDKDYDCKVQQATKQITANPKDVNGYTDRGDAYYNSDRYTEALADYSKWVEMEPSNA